MAADKGQEAPSLSELRQEARTIYGSDVRGYDAGRPDYPAEVYEILTSRCGLRAGASVVEIGPGTGLVTRRLVAAGARVVVVEPDQNMAAQLAAAFGSDVEIIPGTFEQAPLPRDRFDLAVAATSFHWVDQGAGIPKLGRVIRPRGWAAVWWTIFDDPGRQDAFRDALLARTGDGDPGGQRNARFQLDAAARCRDLAERAGLTDVSGNLIRWTAELDTAQLRALYASMIRIRRLPADGQRRILDQISLLADHDFAGRVQRPFMTVMYTGRRPGPNMSPALNQATISGHLVIMADVQEVEVVVAHNERATLRVGDVFLKIDADQTRTDVEVEAMAVAPIPTPQVLWRKPPVLALAALSGRALGRLGEPSTASPAAWAAAGAAARMLHDAPLPPWPGRSLEEIARQLDGECEWLVANEVLPAGLVTRNRRVAEAALRPWTPVFTHGDLQITHVFVDGDKVTGVVDWSEAGPGDALYDLASLTLGHQEHLGDVVAGYGSDVDLDVIRAWWSLRSLRAARWLIEHGFDPSSPGCEFDVLRSQL